MWQVKLQDMTVTTKNFMEQTGHDKNNQLKGPLSFISTMWAVTIKKFTPHSPQNHS